jgi:hypothetical protein
VNLSHKALAYVSIHIHHKSWILPLQKKPVEICSQSLLPSLYVVCLMTFLHVKQL